jgi:hypothetical protein
MATCGDVSLLTRLNLLPSLDGQLAIGSKTHLGSVGRVWFPSRRLSGGSNLLHHSVDLLEGKTLGLPHEEVGVDVAKNTKTTPDEEDLGLEVGLVGVDHVRGDDGDDTVPEPVGGGGKGDTSRSNGQGEDFSDTDPGTWTPGRGEEENVDTDESDLDLDNGRVISLGGTDNGGDKLADPHTKSTVDQKRSTTEFLNGVERNRGGAYVDKGGDKRDQERVGNGTQVLEEDGSKVEDEVDTGPLLHHLERGTEDGSSEVGSRVAETTRETSRPGVNVSVLGDELGLVFVVGDDLGEFLLDVGRFLGLATDSGKRSGGVIESATLDKPSWRFGKHGDSNTKDEAEVSTSEVRVATWQTYAQAN